jgi:3',5'-cyclic AMP phosphodiesterase CpdA
MRRSGTRLWLRLAAACAAGWLATSAVTRGGDAPQRTPAEPHFRFVHLSDTHCARAAENPPLRFPLDPHRKDLVRSFDLLEAAVRQINDQVRPDFVVLTGDLVDRGHDVRSLQRVKGILEGLACPWHVVIGDHDSREAWTQVFGPGRLNYTFRHGGWRFVAVDSSPGRVDAASLARLRRELAADTSSPTALLIHRPLALPKAHVLAADALYGTRLLLGNAAEVRRLVAQHPKVRAVFAGHCHVPIQWQSGQVAHFVAPALAAFGHHFAVVEVRGTVARATYHRVGGEAPGAGK